MELFSSSATTDKKVSPPPQKKTPQAAGSVSKKYRREGMFSICLGLEAQISLGASFATELIYHINWESIEELSV